MKVVIGCDHAGWELKAKLIEHLNAAGIESVNKGTDGPDSVDYPDFAHPTAQAVDKGECDWGILICGSAQGVSMTANKYQNVRAAVAWNNDIARLSREHNNANMICLPARFISEEEALEFVNTFKDTIFEGGRHDRRVQKIACS